MLRVPPESSGPAGLYVHFPFCAVRCTYCDFPTVAGRDGEITAYLRALEREILRFQPELPRAVDTVFFGGGTPSRMSPAQVRSVLDTVERRFDLVERCEVTIECNPESLDAGKLAGYRDAGVTRISVGVQSLDDGVLQRARRAHDASAALRAVELALAAGCFEVNVDLIAGLPGESLRAWRETLLAIAGLGPHHVSVYLLELDKDSPLARSVHRRKTAVSDDDVMAEAYRQTVATLAACGLGQYEISNFARDGKISRHNNKYWTDGWYGGFGLGAHGYVRGARRANRSDLAGYLTDAACDRDPLAWEDPWSPRRRLEEALISGLRRVDGLDLAMVGRRYGVDVVSEYREAFERAGEARLVEWAGTRLRLTDEGRIYSNELFAELIRE